MPDLGHGATPTWPVGRLTAPDHTGSHYGMTLVWIVWVLIVSSIALLLHPIILLAIVGWLLKSAQMQRLLERRAVEAPAPPGSRRHLHPAVKFGAGLVAAAAMLFHPIFGLPVLIFLLVQSRRLRKERPALSETDDPR